MIQILPPYPTSEHKPCDGQAIHTIEDLGEVTLVIRVVVDNVDLHGVGRAIVVVLRALGIIWAPVKVELQHFVVCTQGTAAQHGSVAS